MLDSNKIRSGLDGLRAKAQEFATAINDTLGEVNNLHFAGTTINFSDLLNRLANANTGIIELNGEYSRLDTLIGIARIKLPPRGRHQKTKSVLSTRAGLRTRYLYNTICLAISCGK